MEKKTINNTAIYYLNKLIGVEVEAKRLRDECEKKTSVRISGAGAWFDVSKQAFYIQLTEGIEKLGLPIKQEQSYKQAEINGYYIVEAK